MWKNQFTPGAQDALCLAQAAAEELGHSYVGSEHLLLGLLREEGAAALKDAKASHDKLEAVYNPYVDFDGVRTLAALEAGRLLSWLG